jgi:hypothetical protein
MTDEPSREDVAALALPQCRAGAALPLDIEESEALQSPDRLDMLACRQARSSRPVLSAQNFAASSRQRAMRPGPDTVLCAETNPEEKARNKQAMAIVPDFMAAFL